MLSKREKLYQAAEGLNALRCPVCGGDLTRVGMTLPAKSGTG